ncbi:MAG: AAA family ATPase [archaeon]|nr:AAA family ATPase [archaeon]
MFISAESNRLRKNLEKLREEIKEREREGKKKQADLMRLNAFKRLSERLEELSKNGEVSYKTERVYRETVLDFVIEETKRIDLGNFQSEKEEKHGKENEELEKEMLRLEEEPERKMEDLVGLEKQIEKAKYLIIGAVEHGPGSNEPLPGLDNPYKSRANFLLLGPPGTGKSHFAQALALELKKELGDVHFFAVTGSKIKTDAYGGSERRMDALLEVAQKQNSISVIFVDEFDEIASREKHEATQSIVNTFLGKLSGSKSARDLIFIGASNRPQDIDPAIFSRFEVIEFPLPDEKIRKAMFEEKLSKYKNSLLFRPEDLSNWFSKETEGFSGRDIEEVLSNASVKAVKEARESRRERTMIDKQHVFDSVGEMKEKKKIENKRYV